MASTTRKILMLHGFTQNAAIFSKRMGAIRKACGSKVDFVFVDGPVTLDPADVDSPSNSTTGNALEALGAAEANTNDPLMTPRAWWRVNADRTDMVGLEDSLMLLRDVLKGQHFDGVFGFSQGASMAALLSALLERPQVYPPFLIDGESPHPPMKFCVSVSGFKGLGPLATSIMGDSYATPTLHVIGRNDIVVVEERSRTLLAVSENKRLEEHDGGHFVPSKANWRNFLKAFLTAEDPFSVSPPAPGGSSAPASGTNTPASLL